MPSDAAATRPRVALIATGGTIDAVGASRLDLAWYTETRDRLPDGELLASLTELASIADVHPVASPRVPSYALTDRDWLELARTVTALLVSEDCDGVVITHGTNTVEETAYFLHLTVPVGKPVVLVGAMRPASGLGTDGPLNLLRAVQVAASPQARGRGVLLVMNDTIYSARDVTKTATFRVDAFRAPDTGPLGYADADGRIDFHHSSQRVPSPSPAFSPAGLESLPRVDVVVSYVGADGVLIDAAVAAGARGLVSAGTGAGRPTPAEEGALDRATEAGVVVCQATRVGGGRVSRSPLMRRRGVVVADNLVPWKARVLLALALTRTDDVEDVQDLFDRL
jgi:L-asparaginase